MYQSLNPYRKSLIPLLLLATLVACSRDEVIEDSPATHIAASEKLALPASIELPANMPKGNTRIATYYATGVQKYKAKQKEGSNPATYEWAFVAPQAELYNSNNAKVGSHGAGPFWELSTADSIFAQQFSPAKTAQSPDGNSIDWLLLMPKSGTTPKGIFANVEYIHRIATEGGKAPAAPPTSATQTTELSIKRCIASQKRTLD